MPIKVLIVDDEPLSRERIRMFIEHHEDIEIAAEAGDGEEALRALEQHHPDVVFADVQMPDLSGLEMIRRVEPDERPLVVFVTAFENYAVEAFAVGAVHYLVKPFGRKDVEAAVVRIREVLAARVAGSSISDLLTHFQRHMGSEPLERVVIKRDGRALVLRVDQIDWIEAAGNYSRVHAGGQRHLVRETMSSLEKKLDKRRFVRVHRSALVNIDRIRELQPTSHGDYSIVLHDETRIVLSRRYRGSLEILLGEL
jgi:two-component system LytT family response regulator